MIIYYLDLACRLQCSKTHPRISYPALGPAAAKLPPDLVAVGAVCDECEARWQCQSASCHNSTSPQSSSLLQLQGPDGLRPARPPRPGLVLAGADSVLATVVVQFLFLQHNCLSQLSANISPHWICGFIMSAFHSVNVISQCLSVSNSQIKIIESIKVMRALPVMEPVNPGPAGRKISSQ